MKNKDKFIKFTVYALGVTVIFFGAFLFTDEMLNMGADLAVLSLKMMLPISDKEYYEEAKATTKEPTEAEKTTKTEPTTTKTQTVLKNESFSATPKDIEELIKEAQKSASKDKAGGKIREKQYTNEGVTDKYSLVRMKNMNKTQVSIKEILSRKIDLSVDKEKPSVLIFHTHTTETYQILDRDFYPEGFKTRTNDKGKNMVRVGEAIVEEIEKAGFSVIHDKEIHDGKYTGAYGKSRESIEAILKKHPSIQIVLDIHRDAIQDGDGTKVKPVATVKGKKAAQIMIISGCQEEGNPITNLPDWRYNLTFAVHLQEKLEELFEGITRPLYFCPRSYNMNVTHCSLLIEVGSDSNTLEEAVYTGKCIGAALTEILKEYEE